jgi:hypothetical protein
VAQDAAVISGVNSSEALEDIIKGITTGQTELLHTMDLQVCVRAAYLTISAPYSFSQRRPAFPALAADERLGRVALGVQRVERLLQPLLGGLARVDGASDGRSPGTCEQPVTGGHSSSPSVRKTTARSTWCP